MSNPEIEFYVMKEMYVALSMPTFSERTKIYAAFCMHTCTEKKTFLGKDYLTIVE